MSACTVVVGYREALLAEGIAAALARYPGIVSVGSATTPDEVIRLGARVDAVAIDAELPGAERAASVLRRRGVRVVFLGAAPPDGASVCVSTEARGASLAAALNPRLADSVPAPSRLTIREREVLSLVAQGLAGKQVARQLGISPKTVERHKTKIFSKLAVPNAAAAVGHFLSVRGGGEGASILPEYIRGLQRRWKVAVACLLVALSVGWFFTRSDSQSQASRSYGATTYLISSSTLSDHSAALRVPVNLQTIAALVTLGEVPKRVATHSSTRAIRTSWRRASRWSPITATGLLSISATAPAQRQAILLADAFATELVGFLQDRMLELRRSLQDELDQIDQQILDLERQLATASGEEALSICAERDALEAQRTAVLSQQISLINAAGENASGLEIIEPAAPTPVTEDPGVLAPRSRAGVLVLVGIVGLILGLAVALLLERFDPRIQSKEAAEEAFKLPVLGEIPIIPRRFRGSVVAAAFPRAPASNAFRLLAAALQYGRRDRSAGTESVNRGSRATTPESPATRRRHRQDPMNGGRSWRTILVTSAAPSEGKSTTVANLAATFAELGRQVIVLCCDFRHPSLHVVFDVKQRPGLSEILAAEGPVELNYVLQDTSLERVRVLSTGRVPESTAGLFGSDRMREVLVAARATGDVVLIDSAPVLLTSDWAQLIPEVEAVLVVARSGRTDAGSAERTAEILSTLQAPTVGVVLNGLPRSLVRNGRYGFGFGYGDYGSALERDEEERESETQDDLAEAGTNGAEGDGHAASGPSAARDEGIPQLARPSAKE